MRKELLKFFEQILIIIELEYTAKIGKLDDTNGIYGDKGICLLL